MDNYKLFIRQYVTNELTRRQLYVEQCESIYYRCLSSSSPLTATALARWETAKSVFEAVSDVLSAVLDILR